MCAQVQVGVGQRERIPSRLCGVRAEGLDPMNHEAAVGLDPLNREIVTWAEIKSQTVNRLGHSGAPRCPHIFKLLILVTPAVNLCILYAYVSIHIYNIFICVDIYILAT